MADQAAAEGEERLVDLGAPFVADGESFELLEPGEGAFDDASGSGRAMSGTAVDDLGFDPALAQLATVAARVVGSVSAHTTRATTGPADFAGTEAPARSEWDQLGELMAVTAGERPRRAESRSPPSLTTDADGIRLHKTGPFILKKVLNLDRPGAFLGPIPLLANRPHIRCNDKGPSL